MSNKDDYAALCAKDDSLGLFMQPWWLDAVCGPEKWDVALVKKGDDVQGALPYAVKRKYGLTILATPPLTQCLGPWVKDTGAKYNKRLSHEKDVMQGLIAALPKAPLIYTSWPWRMTNWLPFYWAGFRQTTRYTYVIEDLSDHEAMWANLGENARNEIRKAQSRGVAVVEDAGLDDYLAINAKSYERQQMDVPYDEALVRRLDAACAARGARTILIAKDGEGRVHAGLYLVHDRHSTYYLMGGGDPELRGNGGSSLLMWHALKQAGRQSRIFDFEGSMIEPIERYMRSFGAVQKAYFTVYKMHPVFEIAWILKNYLKKRKTKK